VNSIAENIARIKSSLPPAVKLIAVSKTVAAATVGEALDAGQLAFGENKAQELAAKHALLPNAEWHFLGHLQTNKVKLIAPFVRMIHSVDSLKLIEEINAQAKRNNRVIDCLLQVHIAQEEQKFGMTEDETFRFAALPEVRALANVRLCGLMCVATNTNDTAELRSEFRRVASLFHRLKNDFFPDAPHFSELSMGMSHDYRLAIEEGSTMVRIGSMIFGERNYAR
jgi:pyridoxal phosphate enzyme (YggS family)